MPKTPSPTNLWLRHRTWFLRLSIPPSLRQHFGNKDKIVETLGTADLNVAIAERDRRVAEYHAQFEALRTNTTAASQVYLAARQREKEGYPTSGVAFLPYCEVFTIACMVGKELEEVRKILRIPSEEFKPGPGSKNLWLQYGREALRRKIGPLAKFGPDAWYEQDLYNFFLSEASNTPFTTTTPTPTASNATTAPVITLPAPATSERFSEAVEAHLKSIKSGKRATIDGYKGMAKLFEDYCHNAPITEITRAMAADFLDKHLLEERKVSKRTRNLYASFLQAVFKTAIRRGRFNAANPFEAQKLDVVAQHYEPFTAEEITKLFATATFVARPNEHTVHAALPWVMLIGAYTGARLEEIAQLRVEDIGERDGVRFFDIHNGNGNNLKNESAPRCVPVHSQLIKLGLLDYVAGLPKGSRLFPGLKARASKNGKVGADLGDTFREWRRSVGVVRPRVNFHSLRHTVTNMLDRLGVPETDAARVTGHKIGGVTYSVYSHDGPGLKRLREIVERIEYPGLVIKS